MSILTCADIEPAQLEQLLERYAITVNTVGKKQKIPGSWFGEPEAGIIKNALYIRADTPVHSALHEACHYICMDPSRRKTLHTNAGGDYNEENGVCYLSILLSDYIEGFGRARMFSNMDEWGYTFRLGSSKAWFEGDANDAIDWLTAYCLIDAAHLPTFKMRI